jgi:hypothetical protein
MRSFTKVLSGLALFAAVFALSGTASAQQGSHDPAGVCRTQVASPSTDLTGNTNLTRFDFRFRNPFGFTFQSWGGSMARFGVPSLVAVLRERRGLTH